MVGHFRMRASESDLQQIEKAAKAKGLNKSSYIRMVLIEHGIIKA